MRKICLRCGSKFASQADYCPHDGSPLVTDDEIGDPLLGTLLLEQFRIDEQIGTGGMGTVYRAHQTTVGRDVAIKVLRAELARDEQAVLRFEREARLAISLDHPNLVRVFLSGRLSDGRLYIVMELLEGRSLAEQLEAEGPPSIERALIMIMKLCAGLDAVHAAGIVHRDIKPENVYLVQRGKDEDFVKLVDFGIARVLQAEGIGPTTTQSGRVFGTATYISPEAATGEETDQRSDIYSLGVLTYQLLAGKLPFEGKTAGAVLMQHVHQEPPPLREKGRGEEVPEEVAGVVMRALNKDPDARQQNVAELLDTLAEAAGTAGLLNDARALLFGTIWGEDLAAPGSYLAELLGSSAPPSTPPESAPRVLADTQPVAVERDPEDEALLSAAPKPFGTTSHDLAAVRRPRRRRYGVLWASLALLGLGLVGIVAGTWWSQRTPRADAESTVVPPDPPPVAEEADPQVADIGTDAPVTEPTVTEAIVAEAAAPEEPEVEEPTPPPAEAEPEPPKKKPASKRRRPKKKPAAKTAPPPPAPESPTSGPTPPIEPDEGIDWAVPDFPEEPSPAPDPPGAAPSPDPPPATPAPDSPAPPSEPPPPTGTPDAPARNPIVIDEPPVQ
jgi:serine/threonine-protein kinase